MKFTEQPYIVVQDRGFILVGYLAQHEDALFLTLRRAAVVRRWGTSRGLGQLASEGPQPNTILDPLPGEVIIGKCHIFQIIPCTAPAWREGGA